MVKITQNGLVLWFYTVVRLSAWGVGGSALIPGEISYAVQTVKQFGLSCLLDTTATCGSYRLSVQHYPAMRLEVVALDGVVGTNAELGPCAELHEGFPVVVAKDAPEDLRTSQAAHCLFVG